MNRPGFRVDSSVDTIKNRAEVYVTNRGKFEAELREVGILLPEHVALTEVESLAQPPKCP
ncbi:hypothetical protein BH24ACT22_BH24ACT22_07360 [soil metagenome]